MGRRRRLTPITLTTIAITQETQKTIKNMKSRRETQDNFIRRVLFEWHENKEALKDIETAYNYQSKRIEQYQLELERLSKLIKHNPTIQELR